MKISVILIMLLFLLNGCTHFSPKNNSSTSGTSASYTAARSDLTSDICLVYMYTNYAWGYQCHGSFFDADGYQYSFNFSDLPRDLSDTDRIDLMREIRNDATVHKQTFSAGDMEYMLNTMASVNENTGFVETNIMYDYGQRTVYGVRYENNTPKFVRLYSYGDWTQEPIDINAAKIVNRFFTQVPRPN